MASFRWVSIAVRAPDGWLDLGVLMRRGRELRWTVVDDVHPEVAAHLAEMVERANADGTVDDLWEYLLDRGIGGLSSVSAAQALRAPTWAVALRRALDDQPQHVSGE